MLEAYGVATLADGRVLELSGDAAELLAYWSPDNLIVSVVDPSPFRGEDPEDCNLLLVQNTGGDFCTLPRVSADQTKIELANRFLLDCTS